MFDVRTPPRPRVVCLGLSAYDLTWTVEALPRGSGKTRALGLTEGCGGMAANAAVTVARLGGAVRFWGRAGQDDQGVAMREALERSGIDVSGFRLFPGARSSVSGIIVDRHGERAIVNFRGEGLPEDAGWLPVDSAASADAVLADPRWPEGAMQLFRVARSHGVPTVLDGDVADPEVFDRLLPLVDYAVFSAPALAAYARGAGDLADQLAFARSRGCAVAAVTLGERGTAWLEADGLRTQPAFPVVAVDTTGAGDVFHGALAFALGARAPLPLALRFSSAVAALKCMAAGGRAGIPDLATSVAFLEQESKEPS